MPGSSLARAASSIRVHANRWSPTSEQVWAAANRLGAFADRLQITEITIAATNAREEHRQAEAVERFYRAAKVLEIYEGTKEIQKNTIASAVIGKIK